MRRDDWIALLPDKPVLSKDDIQRRMGGLDFTLSADPRLHFRVLAPLGWTWRDPQETESPPGVLLSLVRGSPPNAEIVVAVDELRREMSPAEWARIKLERAGHTLLHQREMDTPIGALADILTEVDGPDGRFIARTNMAKDANRVFSITCQARADVYRERADEFFITLSSFKLLHPEKAPFSEQLRQFGELYPVVFGFRYPASWSLAEEVASAETCDVRLDNFDEDRCAGRIYVQARAAERPRRLMSGFLARLEKAGLQVEGRLDLTPCDPKAGFVAASSMVAPATFDGDKFEIRALVLEIEAAALLVAVGGPARAMSPEWWAINKRAFDIVRDTIYAV